MLNFKIDESLCVKCGLCADDCPSSIISLDEFPVISNEARCIGCQHCISICPTKALSIFDINPDSLETLAGNLPDSKKVEILIKSRRSVRSYKNEAIGTELIKELIDVAWHAPTGANAQKVLVTVVDDINITNEIREEVYKRLLDAIQSNSMADKPEMQYLGWASKMREKIGKDIIFRGAPHLIITSAPKNTACPIADAHIFLSYFELYAQSKKIGTLWNGMAKWAFDSIFPDIKEKLGIPENHVFGYVMLFGKPAVEYQRVVTRSPAKVNYVKSY